MSNTATVLAFDFGASSGRAIRAVYDGQNLTYEEIHRFENVPIEKGGHLFWDVETLLKEIHTAIQKAGTFDSLGFDTWGVDFGLLDADGHLLANPVHYRDARTNGKPEQAAARMPAEELYAHTGNQIMAINTLFQLLALREQEPELLQRLSRSFLCRICSQLCWEPSRSANAALRPPARCWTPHRAVEQRSAGRLRLAGKPLRAPCCQRHGDRHTCKRCENHCGGRA